MALLPDHERTQPVIDDAKYTAQRMRDDQHPLSRLRLSLIGLRAPPTTDNYALAPVSLELTV
jgi:hypothetical protein